MTMTQQAPILNPWADEELVHFLRLRMKTFWNLDYFERVVLPLLDLPIHSHVLDVGCGNGGISFHLAERRPDLRITGIDFEPKSIEDASFFAERNGIKNLNFEQGDAHQLRFDEGMFDGVVCQTMLTHVRDAQSVVREMARVLKSGGVFFAAEYTDSGAISNYDNVHFQKRDEAWYREYFRLHQLYVQGKQSLGRGDETVGLRVPLLATQAGLDVYDVRLNDRVTRCFPPYRHEKQRNYLEMVKTANAPDTDDRWLRLTIETILAGCGTEAEARWLYGTADRAAIVQAIIDGSFMGTGSFLMYLTFAKKL
jgi:ubiquinone/menaquinone biosynthesis C-methylase UbiE